MSMSLEQEHTDLLKRITDLQADKWTLEEKVCIRGVLIGVFY